jgi:hypothetical protein
MLRKRELSPSLSTKTEKNMKNFKYFREKKKNKNREKIKKFLTSSLFLL